MKINDFEWLHIFDKSYFKFKLSKIVCKIV